MAVSLYAALTVPYRLDDRAAFDYIMDAWQDAAPGLVPTKADSIEPVRRPFDLADRDDAAQSWGQSLWIGLRSKPKLQVTILTGPFLHSNLIVRLDQDREPVLDDLVALISSLASATSAHYGVVHQLTAAEIAEAREVRRPDLLTINRVTGKSTLGVGYTRQLQRGIPTLFWQNLFGIPYVELFGRTRLLAAPAAVVREEPWGVLLQVAEFAPTEENWPEFRLRRNEVIDYLGREAFWPVGNRIPDAMTDFEPPPLVTTR